jgi:RNA polymerase sigma-B factor
MPSAPGTTPSLAIDCRDSNVLLRRYAARRDPRDLEELTRRFGPLARRLARRYGRGGEPLDDLEQVANLGLVKALQRFDPGRGFAFGSFAVPTILGELKRSFRDSAWAAHVPRAVQERVGRLREAAAELEAEVGRAPTPRELAARLGCSIEVVLDALAASNALATLSLDGAGDDAEHPTIGDALGAEDDGFARVEDLAALAHAFPALTEAQREVLRLRFEEDLFQSDIARRTGVSQMQVSRTLRAAIERLRALVEHQGAVPRRLAA